MKTQILAHAGESHSSELEAAAHELPWFLQVLLFLMGIALVYTLVWIITKKVDTSLLILSFALLVTGFLVFQVAPIVSVLAITLGLITTLFVTFVGLGADTNKKK